GLPAVSQGTAGSYRGAGSHRPEEPPVHTHAQTEPDPAAAAASRAPCARTSKGWDAPSARRSVCPPSRGGPVWGCRRILGEERFVWAKIRTCYPSVGPAASRPADGTACRTRGFRAGGHLARSAHSEEIYLGA